jgi:hypothetical protein
MYLNRIILFILLVINSSYSIAQCSFKTMNREDGVSVKYFNPDLVGSSKNIEVGLSTSESDGVLYCVSVTVRFTSGNAKDVDGNLKINLSNNTTVELEFYTSQQMYVGGSETTVAIFLVSDEQFEKLKASNIKQINFQFVNDSMWYPIPINAGKMDLVKKQFNCY